mgnify:CR=1 FL=1
MPSEQEQAALATAQGLAPTAENIARVARLTRPEAAAWAFTQWELRARAKGRFPEADRLLFDRDGLAMASSAARSEYHAALFPTDERALDLTCGLGFDLMALARRGPATGFETDRQRAAYARHNLAALGLTAEVHPRAARPEEWRGHHVFLDPMRRGPRGRLQADDYSPNPWAMLPELRQAASFAIKLSPLVPDARLAEFGGAVEFLSDEGQCAEAVALSSGAGVWAVHLAAGERLRRAEPPRKTEVLGEYLYEADPAAVRAHALAHFGLDAVGDHPGFLTGGPTPPTPWLRAFRVVRTFSPKEKPGPVSAVKKRGPTPEPEALRRKWGYDPAGPIAFLWTERRAVRACLAVPADVT